MTKTEFDLYQILIVRRSVLQILKTVFRHFILLILIHVSARCILPNQKISFIISKLYQAP